MPHLPPQPPQQPDPSHGLPHDLPEPGFPPEEYAQRLAGTREAMACDGLDLLLVTAPEDIHYHCGLNHQGHFAVTALLLPLDGTPVLVERAMEAPTARAQTHDVAHHGYGDGTAPAEALVDALAQLARPAQRVGYQADTLTLPPAVWDRLRRDVPVTWTDCGDLLILRRSVHTAREIGHLRSAARLSDTAMAAGLAAATAGARENEVAAAVHDAMFRAGGDLPGFAPLVRSTDRLDQEHLTWTRREFGPRDGVFLELSAAYGRYHAPLARLHHLDPREAARHRPAAEASRAAMRALCAALRPDRTAEQVFGAWRAAVEEATGRPYRRHHCGYLVGIGFPPSWMAGTRTLRPGNPLRLRAGMTFHVQSWVLDERLGRYACSDTALVTEDGCEVLTRTPYPN
ncbi:M24 family metallopeptidase [Streptomyces sp. NRRL S-1448]|uniref:M24 family metallopeptidase n=1 Tax=Streptomyces sp. NRRL S-1448 TaxID=1463883 RepID=UPI00068D3310|nr:Xaa-Pro peptidase family protein [Streptomyces sp. NRRL S-1448]